MILAVAGNFDWRRLCEHVEQLFGDWPAGEPPEPTTVAGPPLENHIPFDSNQAHVAIAYPTIPYKHPDYFQSWAAVGILSSGSSSRLFTEVREKRGLCYTVYASLHTQRERASVLCYAGTTAERAQETLDVTIARTDAAGRGHRAERTGPAQGPHQELADHAAGVDSASRSGAIARDWYHLGRVRTLDEVGQIIDALSSESINAFLRANPPQDLLVVTLGPEPLEVPVGVS